MAQTHKYLRLVVQKDPGKTTYMLDGMGRVSGVKMGLARRGWQWLAGRGGWGVWETEDLELAKHFAYLPTFDTHTQAQIVLEG
jgi:hypothetical protein